jgi:hypothetical protein
MMNTLDTTPFEKNDDKVIPKLSQKYPSEAPNELVEQQTKKIPNLLFMGLAGASIVGSIAVAIRAGKKTDVANFVGHWAPTFLLLGIYNKLVKVEDEILEPKATSFH